MSKTIAINAGSSSLKWQLFEMPSETVIAKGIVERIGLPESIFTIKYGEGQKFEEVLDINDHEFAVEMLLKQLLELNIIASFNEITGVGHRVVAGGEIFKDSALITDEVLGQIEDLSELAPLHNPANATGIRAFKKLLPEITSVAVFDTSFHTTMPKKSYLYSIPMKYYEDFAARKYGAHGTSHKFVSERAAEMLGRPLEELKLISCHLGNGASITAIDGGKSVDTSMGFTPLAGVTMGTRSGDIDPSLIAYLMGKLNITDINEFINILNKESGLLGLSEISSDMRDLEVAQLTDDNANIALRIFADRIKKYIGSYIATMNGVDAIIFTAGIGENDIHMRKEIIDGITVFGCEMDAELNNVRSDERVISTADSKVKVLLIPTDEEVMIARDVERLSK
ncbi:MULTISPECIES: acetate/propionate family kinase [Carnobacterium]|uniref:Acetate kinase n=2 Tax=Carnobacterium divergens TaxID=2748 RepID=A0A0R2HSM1_CARDV|nr:MULTISPECIES: acetate kinase [Carnobacterium]AOA00189.1 acetate kinase [Carnobacterium divergens]KRN54566.1 acetate kinase [Carnobacterium divergens DSM 20623]MCO6017516.1 acetate kinase [Carnobacterium divergens]MDO0874050.1 acetate kinase [Carnobacterium divergens]MDT1939117.1 acetate kinase [Carnobacterium divergens]